MSQSSKLYIGVQLPSNSKIMVLNKLFEIVNVNLVLLLIYFPLFSLLITLVLSWEKGLYRTTVNMYILNFFSSLIALYSFFSPTKNLLTSYTVNLWKPINLTIDNLSIWYIVLSSFLMLVIIILIENIKNMHKEYIACLSSMALLLNLVFMIQDIFVFYLIFESMVIPMFILIGVWGSRSEKVKAAYYFIVYTIAGSLILLIAILQIFNKYGTTSFELLELIEFDRYLENLLFLGFFLSFSAKIPLIPFHIWLPLAHVEAPLAGSLLLAGILIKLGTYGYIKFALALTPNACAQFAPFMIMLSIISIIYASLSTIRQTDLKRVIAYSSVAHMGVATLSIFTMTKIGVAGSIFLQIAHGLVSSALFILVTILYNHHHTRTIAYYRGVALCMPIFSSFFVFFSLCNIGMPLTGNFIGEFLCLYAGFRYSFWVSFFSGLGVILSASYALFLVSRVCYGGASKYLKWVRDINKIEGLVLLTLTFLILLMGIFPNIILSIL